MRVLQSYCAPDGLVRAVIRGPIRDAIEHTASHFVEHSEPGETVSIVPFGFGFAVQLHDRDGRLLSWNYIREVS